MKLSKESKGVYFFTNEKGEKVYVMEFFTQTFNKKSSDVITVSTGWGIDPNGNHWPTLAAFKKAYGLS